MFEGIKDAKLNIFNINMTPLYFEYEKKLVFVKRKKDLIYPIKNWNNGPSEWSIQQTNFEMEEILLVSSNQVMNFTLLQKNRTLLLKNWVKISAFLHSKIL